MDYEYDKKFQEMKKYIPFLESMVKRLEGSNLPTNPRQAQLDKIKSLRDLLQDKKKRMKMDNLLKCEQVLVNLYAKVEQKDSNVTQRSEDKKIHSDLNTVRNKLKSVVSKLTIEKIPETATSKEGHHTDVSDYEHQPLFQRRQNCKTISPVKDTLHDDKKPSPSKVKRNYTRVLLSPEKSSRKWSDDAEFHIAHEKPLYSRRSPRKSSHRYSPSYKKERKKLKKSKQLKDFNITLNVPEESLNSLNTEDILERIINCSDNDVDIATLRELRSQILGELKHTGAKDDISDLLLKSCNKKNQNKTKGNLKKDEVEEGELSDSESEAIENIYGSLVILDKEKSTTLMKTSSNKEKACKIQICLVINSDKKEADQNTEHKNATMIDVSDFESFNKIKGIERSVSEESKSLNIKPQDADVQDNYLKEDSQEDKYNEKNHIIQEPDTEITPPAIIPSDVTKETQDKVIQLDENEISVISKESQTSQLCESNYRVKENKDVIEVSDKDLSLVETDTIKDSTDEHGKEEKTEIPRPYMPNFYKPNKDEILDEQDTSSLKSADIPEELPNDTTNLVSDKKCDEKSVLTSINMKVKTAKPNVSAVCSEKKQLEPSTAVSTTEDSIDIPLLNLESNAKQEIVSEIDILQALKKEILGETITSTSDIDTPLLHLPKVTKVASAQDIAKKRISIENYKQKCSSSPQPLFLRDGDKNKIKKDPKPQNKQSLKLTEKECERFNLPLKLPLSEDSDDDNNSIISIDDIYCDLAPKSPDHEDFADTGIKPPVIIPSDPVKPVVENSSTDIDMRNPPSLSANIAVTKECTLTQENDNENTMFKLSDPRRRTRCEPQQLINDANSMFNDPLEKSNKYIQNLSMNQCTLPLHSPSMTPSHNTVPSTPIAPNRTPLFIPNMTPNTRTYDITPSRPNYEFEETPVRKHVYAPMFSTGNVLEPTDISPETQNERNNWEDKVSRNSDYNRYNMRSERYDPWDNYGRLECPQTPVPSFGRQDCPPTPLPSFGRNERAITPINTYNRSDGSSTPIHSFNRTDNSYSYRRSEGSATPIHSYTYSDGSTSRSFDRSDNYQSYASSKSLYGRPEPRYHRKNDYRNFNAREKERDEYYKNRKFYSDSKYEQRYSDSYMRHEQSYQKSNVIRTRDAYGDSRYYNDYIHRRESSSGRSVSRDRESFTRNNAKSSRTFSERKSYLPRNVTPDRKYSYKKPIDKDTKLSVHNSTGPSITIDTSIQTTFQSFKKTNTSSNFDIRRQRAASVGRTLIRACNQPKNKNEKDQDSKTSDVIDKHKDFRRASSVGREVYEKRAKSFNDIKADLKSFKLKNDFRIKNHDKTAGNMSGKIDTQFSNESLKRVKESTYSGKSHERYSPRKNYRDPRMRRESRFDQHYQKKNTPYVKPENKSGIVYSDMNISQGTILSLGSGVKNYKIPKIKRSPEKFTAEVESSVDVDKKADNETDKVCIDTKLKSQDLSKERNNSLKSEISDTTASKVVINKDLEQQQHIRGQSEKRLTRSSKSSFIKESSLKYPPVRKTRKPKRNIIDDDSDKEMEENIKNLDSESGDIKEVIEDTNTIESSKNKNNDTKDVEVEILDINVHNATAPSVNTENSEDLASCENLNLCNKSVLNDRQETSHENVTSKILEKSFDHLKTDLSANKLINDHLLHSDSNILGSLPNIDSNEKNNELNSSFGDLEIFSDNIVSDPVLDNINALIEDLDNDLETVKSNESRGAVMEEILLNNMMECAELEENKSTPCNSVNLNQMELQSGKESISKEGNASDTPKNDSIEFETIDSNEKSFINKTLTLMDRNKREYERSTQNEENDRNENVVSTTKDDVQSIGSTLKSINRNILSSEKEEVPDSTINLQTNVKVCDEIVPDSTNEANEYSDVSCSNSVNDSENIKDRPSKDSDKGDSIGKLLSILQDKTKIKELLSLLGEQASENAKIKKKLEKLSEIVSDDEDDSATTKETEIRIENASKEDIVLESNLPENNSLENRDTIENNDNNVSPVKSTQEETLENKSDALQDSVAIKSIDRIEETNVSDNISEKEYDQKSYDFETEHKVKKSLKKPKRQRKGFKKGLRARNGSIPSSQSKPKKPSRELLSLRADIRDVYEDDEEILGGTTGLRMCRIAKLVEKPQSVSEEVKHTAPIVRLEKVTQSESSDKKVNPKNTRKGKAKEISISEREKRDKDCNLQQKSSTLDTVTESLRDPYRFETDSINESSSTKKSESSEFESDSAESLKSTSTENLPDIKKKPKRKRGAWQSGIISKNKKKKTQKTSKISSSDAAEKTKIDEHLKVSDIDCYTDKSYCFTKDVLLYSCRLCEFTGTDIVQHYKNQHPHSEIPLARVNAEVADIAIKQCETVDFQSISKIPNYRYVCLFCFKEFNKCKSLESFFWHIVRTHTGEYNQKCTLCESESQCQFHVDVPPPPIKQKGQLIGHICGSCNYTQISFENLKTHVVVRHNNEETEVYSINLSHMTNKSLNMLIKRARKLNSKETKERILRSSRSNISTEFGEEKSDLAESDICDSESTTSTIQDAKIESEPNHGKIQSKITFENDSDMEKNEVEKDNINNIAVKKEPIDMNESKESEIATKDLEDENLTNVTTNCSSMEHTDQSNTKDIFELPHFKACYTESGAKEYVCCIYNSSCHYKTSLLISFKKHVQLKHSEKWDGYCCLCNVIVTPQGFHSFKNCLQHFIDNHIDNFPVFEKSVDQSIELSKQQNTLEAVQVQSKTSPKPFLSVRPLSELVSSNSVDQLKDIRSSPLPVIESVVSLGSTASPNAHFQDTNNVLPKRYLYEEAQAEIMSKKNQIILDTMMSHEKLVQVFKCAGRFCYYTTDNAEDALLHASTHTRVGGENALKCAYCDFNASHNAIDLVTHVFKNHGFCQFACGYCFYRAAASQLVNAHINRVHPTMPVKTVLKTSFTTEPMNEANMILSREAAVPIYICNCDDADSISKCKFKTYTPGKLCEHIKTKHSHVTVHECFICQAVSSSIGELIHHYKSHGLKLYQCAWCVFGADDENELLNHASLFHPANQPKAYLRVITNKEGTSEFRVLPLAHLNKSSIPTTDITTTSVKENPVREAERSVELEKLIGHTTMFIESMATTTAEPTEEIHQDEPIISESMLNFLPDQTLRTQTPPVPVTIDEQSTPVIKHEKSSDETTTQFCNDTEVIVCLDSDDEVSNISTVSDTSLISTKTQKNSSDDNSKSKVPEKFQLKDLFKCSKCKIISSKPNEFRTHIAKCFLHDTQVQCAHCSFKLNKNKILSHYRKIHLTNEPSRFNCVECKESFTTLDILNNHRIVVHNASNLSTEVVDQTVDLESSKRKPLRRKISASGSSGEPPIKIKKFGPNEIDQLPINPIFDDYVYCTLCEFSTKVRLNMFRHLQLHASQQPVPQTAPVNPVPHLETNEKHFDKMVNLASSSLSVRQDKNSTVTVLIPPEKASRYPKYVPERTRHTCGAKGCSYISLDENMLKYHWETLHSGSNDFHCVHCPPYQTLDTKMPLTASRIIGHLRMHDVRLYACSQCKFYHYKRQIVEKHVNEIHKSGNVLIVREEISNPIQTNQPATQPTIAAPTMDLKPWQCGLCEFKSLLRPKVAEHCAKIHNSKMQFKCIHCAFRTSNLENIPKHQSKSHQGKATGTFYYYYREGSLPDEQDGTPFWKTQKAKFNIIDTVVKTESTETAPSIVGTSASNPPTTVNLSLVKHEIEDLSDDTVQDLCQKFGQFCDPNGLRYKCPLCKNVIEDTKDAMQSHLFEELQYRKWSCGVCFYKAFHKRGLNEHMHSEHHQNREPVELPKDARIELWVTKLLDHQETLIRQNKYKLEQQKIEIMKTPGSSELKNLLIENQTNTTKSVDRPSKEELEIKFGSLGLSKNMCYCCPKCNEVIKEENVMRDHLESELNKIRWCCSTCPQTFQSYHQAQFHCKSHSGQSSRPVEAPRDSALRKSWIDAVLEVQKLSMNYVPLSSDMEEVQPSSSQEPPENSLLVVMYEEKVPIPEVQTAQNRSMSDSDDDRLVINEPSNNRKRKASLYCKYCDFVTTVHKTLNSHILRHYGLKPHTCVYCKLTGTIGALRKHQKIYHPMMPINILNTPVPSEPPHEWLLQRNKADSSGNIVCLNCESSIKEIDMNEHVHENVESEFARIGEVIVNCSKCQTLHKDINKFKMHAQVKHAEDQKCCVFFKLTHENRRLQTTCSYCLKRFNKKEDLIIHVKALHSDELKYATIQPQTSKDVIILDDEEEVMAELTPRKKVAKKSTTKLPFSSGHKTVARKSTSKLPMSHEVEYSFYGTKPSTAGLENVTTLMPFYNTLVPVTLDRLAGILNIHPRVVVAKMPNPN